MWGTYSSRGAGLSFDIVVAYQIGDRRVVAFVS